MSVVVIASYIVAAALAVSRLLTAAKPFWAILPHWLAVIIPSVVAMLPVLIDQMGMVHTGIDLVQGLIVAGAVLLPGSGVPPANGPDTPAQA